MRIVLYMIPEIKLPVRRGRPYVYLPSVIMCCFLVMVAKKLTIRGLYAFLTLTDDYQAVMVRTIIPFPDGTIPNRRTFDRRLKNWQYSVHLYMIALVYLLIKRFRLAVARLSFDNRMFEAVGALWHMKDLTANRIPEGLRNVDKSAGWGVSHYRGWVFGHALEVIVTTGKLVIPLLAFSHSLRTRGNTVIGHIVRLLPRVKKGVIAGDSEYFDQKLGRMVEATGRNLHAPSKQNPKQTPKSQTYKRRKTTVEPYFERFLQAFVLRGKLDRKGPNAWGYLVTCCFLYQLMVFYNLLNHTSNPLQVTHLIRIL